MNLAQNIRKVLHALLAVGFVLGAQWLPSPYIVAGAVILLGVCWASRYLRHLDPVRTAERQSYGEYFFALGVIVSALLFLPASPGAFTAGMLVLGFADSAASLVGRRFGKHTYHVFGEKRSWEGSVAACMVSFVVLLGVGVHLPSALAGAVLLTLTEALSVRGSDNLTLPVLAGLVTSISI